MSGCRENKKFKGGFYIDKEIKENIIWPICIILGVSLLLCWISYPGFMNTDSYNRILLAQIFPELFKEVISGTTLKIPFRLTYVPSMFMSITYALTKEWGLYIGLQCFCILCAVYYYALNMCKARSKTILFLLFATPIYMFYAVFWDAGVGCVTAIIFWLLLVEKSKSCTNKSLQSLLSVISALVIFIILGYRSNAITILPILVLSVCLMIEKFSYKIRMFVSIAIGSLILGVMPKIVHVESMNVQYMGIIWEIVSTIDCVDDAQKQEYEKYLDDVFGNGITEEALRVNHFRRPQDSINDIWWGRPFDVESTKDRERNKLVLDKFIRIIKEEPLAYVRMKKIQVANTLGFNGALFDREYYYDRNGEMKNVNFNDCKGRRWLFFHFMLFNDAMEIYKVPWIYYLVAFVLFLINTVVGGEWHYSIKESSLLISVFYYGGFLINTQAYEFRYFFPAWVLVSWYIVASFYDLCRKRRIKISGKEKGAYVYAET